MRPCGCSAAPEAGEVSPRCDAGDRVCIPERWLRHDGGMADVIVVGGGIIGRTAAVRLRQAGADVVVWSPDEPGATVSSVAAAVWYPTRTDYDPRVLTWAGDTYDEFTRQAADGVPGVLLRPTRNLEFTGADTMPWWTPAAGAVEIAAAGPPYPPGPR